MLREKKFKFPPGCSVKEMTIRETNGHDEQKAAMFAEAKGDKSSTFQELIRVSITSVNGEKVQQPYAPLDEWNSKTRALVIKAFTQLNELGEKEVADFLESAEEVSAENETQLRSVKV